MLSPSVTSADTTKMVIDTQTLTHMPTIGMNLEIEVSRIPFPFNGKQQFGPKFAWILANIGGQRVGVQEPIKQNGPS